MSIQHCENCNRNIDTDLEAEHFEECAMENMLEMGLSEEAERQLEDYKF